MKSIIAVLALISTIITIPTNAQTAFGHIDILQTGDMIRGSGATPRRCNFFYVKGTWRALSHDHPSVQYIFSTLLSAEGDGRPVMFYFTGQNACGHQEIDLVNIQRSTQGTSRSTSRRKSLSPEEIQDAVDILNGLEIQE